MKALLNSAVFYFQTGCKCDSTTEIQFTGLSLLYVQRWRLTASLFYFHALQRRRYDPHGVSVHILFKQSVTVLTFLICDGGFSIPAAHRVLQMDHWFPGDLLWAGPAAGWFVSGNLWFALHRHFGLRMMQVKGNKKYSVFLFWDFCFLSASFLPSEKPTAVRTFRLWFFPFLSPEISATSHTEGSFSLFFSYKRWHFLVTNGGGNPSLPF